MKWVGGTHNKWFSLCETRAPGGYWARAPQRGLYIKPIVEVFCCCCFRRDISPCFYCHDGSTGRISREGIGYAVRLLIESCFFAVGCY